MSRETGATDETPPRRHRFAISDRFCGGAPGAGDASPRERHPRRADGCHWATPWIHFKPTPGPEEPRGAPRSLQGPSDSPHRTPQGIRPPQGDPLVTSRNVPAACGIGPQAGDPTCGHAAKQRLPQMGHPQECDEHSWPSGQPSTHPARTGHASDDSGGLRKPRLPAGSPALQRT